MRRLMIIETRDAADHKDPARMVELAIGICQSGVPTTIFLAENGAFNVRGVSDCRLDAAIADGVIVAVDRFALNERAIDSDSLSKRIAVADVHLIVDGLADGSCVMWR